METIFAQLKQARESRNMSVADVAEATSINPDFLAAIEEGRTNILPQAYVRAFLREFASVVGLDPQRIMEEYEAGTARGNLAGQVVAQGRGQKTVGPPEPAVTTPSPRPRQVTPTAIAAVVAVVVLGTILYWNFSRSPERLPEQSTQVEIGTVPEPEKSRPEQPVPPPREDSLRLGARTSDTVWVQIIIDSRDSLDYVLSPNSVRRWMAGESFKISVGRSEAVKFTLNDAEIGALGDDSRVIRNVLLDRTTLSRLRQEKQR